MKKPVGDSNRASNSNVRRLLGSADRQAGRREIRGGVCDEATYMFMGYHTTFRVASMDG